MAVRALLEHGADANARKNDYTTPLHQAAECESFYVVRVLLEHGANVGAEDGDGKTPIQVVSNKNSYKRMQGDMIMELLSEHGGR